jgi:hypothetical protein
MCPIAIGDVDVGATVRRRGRSVIFTECTFLEPIRREVAAQATATWVLTTAAAVHQPPDGLCQAPDRTAPRSPPS